MSKRRKPAPAPIPAAPSLPWALGPTPTAAAKHACARARQVFGNRDSEVDAVLGWLFARFPIYGAVHADMAPHYVLLSSDHYYDRWVEFCRALVLFPRDV